MLVCKDTSSMSAVIDLCDGTDPASHGQRTQAGSAGQHTAASSADNRTRAAKASHASPPNKRFIQAQNVAAEVRRPLVDLVGGSNQGQPAQHAATSQSDRASAARALASGALIVTCKQHNDAAGQQRRIQSSKPSSRLHALAPAAPAAPAAQMRAAPAAPATQMRAAPAHMRVAPAAPATQTRAAPAQMRDAPVAPAAQMRAEPAQMRAVPAAPAAQMRAAPAQMRAMPAAPAAQMRDAPAPAQPDKLTIECEDCGKHCAITDNLECPAGEAFMCDDCLRHARHASAAQQRLAAHAAANEPHARRRSDAHQGVAAPAAPGLPEDLDQVNHSRWTCPCAEHAVLGHIW